MPYFKWPFFVLALLVSSLAAAESLIVSDYLPINVRGPEPNGRIIAAVKSGSRVTVLEKAKGYIKVRTPKGNEGWVLERFLQREPVARELLDAARNAQQKAESELSALREVHAKLEAEHKELQALSLRQASEASNLTNKLAQIGGAGSNRTEIQQANESLQQQLADSQKQLLELQDQYKRRDVYKEQMLLGAGLLLIGLLLGLIAPLLSGRRRRGWG